MATGLEIAVHCLPLILEKSVVASGQKPLSLEKRECANIPLAQDFGLCVLEGPEGATR